MFESLLVVDLIGHLRKRGKVEIKDEATSNVSKVNIMFFCLLLDEKLA